VENSIAHLLQSSKRVPGQLIFEQWTDLCRRSRSRGPKARSHTGRYMVPVPGAEARASNRCYNRELETRLIL